METDVTSVLLFPQAVQIIFTTFPQVFQSSTRSRIRRLRIPRYLHERARTFAAAVLRDPGTEFHPGSHQP